MRHHAEYVRRSLDEMREGLEEVEQLFPELWPRSPWERAKEAIRRRRSAAKVAPLTADDEVITLGPALTRLFVSQGETQLLDEIASRNQAIRQQYAS
ncbi:hypothetical protein E2562_026619 [Oryza meyeriana var. granulata]|uniref:Uncharacterized protein n=1 Tax=Oryza meyeriana var. granulata TaxID=110450 RepID=A0A6G1D775_9ORYZ|nr:hypothetical protein E2562_026619 [Oryza meyeriana var. granulata]